MTTIERATRALTALAISFLALPARAEAPPLEIDPVESFAPPPDAERDTAPDSVASEERPSSERTGLDPAFAYLPSPALPRPWDVVGSYAASYASTESAARPLAALSRGSGLVNELGAELGVLPRLSLAGVARLAPPGEGETSGRAAGEAGLRLALTEPTARSFRMVVGAGYARDFAAVSAPFLDLTATLDVERVRFAARLHGEKAIDSGRDAVDLIAASGVSVRAFDELRLGAEYVGQDFEDAWEPEEAEGGVRHFAGLTVALTPSERVSLVGGPAIGLSDASPRLLGRIAVSALF